MDYFLFALALVLLLSAGAGLTSILAPGSEELGLPETAALSFLLGTVFISVASFLIGFFVIGFPLRLILSITAGSLGLLGIVRFRKTRSVRLTLPRGRDWLWIGILFIQSLIVLWVSIRLSLGYDGLFLWEAKARLIFAGGGGVPLDHFRATPLEVPYPDYPLLLPFTESWFYGFLGRPHQGWLKLVIPLFYLSAVCLLARSRLSKSCLPAVLLFFVPVILIRATSGEADFPLAVFYLAASLFLLSYMETGDSRLLRMAGVLAAALPWIKREGLILFVVLMFAGAVSLLRKRELRGLIVLAAPGILWIGFWRFFLGSVDAQSQPDYFPMTFETFTANIGRVPAIAAASSKEIFNWRVWSLLWLIPLGHLLSLKRSLGWLFLVVAPVVVYAGIYIFSAWEPFTQHVVASYSRLLVHVSLVALLGLNGLGVRAQGSGVRV